MKKTCMLIPALVCILLAGNAFAQAMKIGVVSVESLISQSESGKRAKAEFEKFTKPKLEGLKKEDERLKAEFDELKKQETILSQDAKAAKLKDFFAKKQAMDMKRAQTQEEFSKKEAELLKPIRDSLKNVIVGYAERNGYSLILSNDLVSSVVFAVPTIDVTKAMLDDLNKGRK